MGIERRLTAVGLQSSGKTTFAAALWYLLDSGDAETVLVKGRHTGDYRYLETLAGYWANGWKVPRTPSRQFQNIRINLKDPRTSGEFEFQMVDLSGETFERAFATDLLGEEAADTFDGTYGLLLFVSAALPRDDVTILDVARGIGERVADDDGADDSTETGPFDPAKTPRQIQVVDLLQRLRDQPMSLDLERVAVIVSAWDKGPEHDDPDRWLREQMPLLSQYLTNGDIAYRVYGVSAQGGDVPEKGRETEPSDRPKLMQFEQASNRIRVVGHGAIEHDLTHPIRWLSDLDGDE